MYFLIILDKSNLQKKILKVVKRIVYDHNIIEPPSDKSLNYSL